MTGACCRPSNLEGGQEGRRCDTSWRQRSRQAAENGGRCERGLDAPRGIGRGYRRAPPVRSRRAADLARPLPGFRGRAKNATRGVYVAHLPCVMIDGLTLPGSRSPSPPTPGERVSVRRSAARRSAARRNAARRNAARRNAARRNAARCLAACVLFRASAFCQGSIARGGQC